MDGNRIAELCRDFAGLPIAVVGDYLLDRYIVGETERVSREAPVVVIRHRDTTHHPGGAANAACNIAALGGRGHCLGLVGSDEEGAVLRGMLEQRGLDCRGLLVSRDHPTAMKTRIVAGDLHAQKQQVARVDRIYKLRGREEVVGCLAEKVYSVLAGCRGLLLSDYGSGLLPGSLGEKALAAAREMGIPVVVDSRHRVLSFPGATTATPNEVEAREALGIGDEDMEIQELADRLLEASGMPGLIITRGSLGMYVAEGPGRGTPLGVVGSGQALDVTGAGDTVAAAVTLALAAGAGLVEAAHLASYAAAVVVMERGTAQATVEEILELNWRVEQDGGREAR